MHVPTHFEVLMDLVGKEANGTLTMAGWHPYQCCTGVDCPWHPLIKSPLTANLFATLSDASLRWGDWAVQAELDAIASETPAEKAERSKREAQQELERDLGAKAFEQAQYAEKCKLKAHMGVKRNQAVQKIAQPCKCLYELSGRGYTSRTVSSECWAWEYTDAKKKVFKAPRTCQYLHPGEIGWLAEWNNLSMPRSQWRVKNTPPPQAPPMEHRFSALKSVPTRESAW